MFERNEHSQVTVGERQVLGEHGGIVATVPATVDVVDQQLIGKAAEGAYEIDIVEHALWEIAAAGGNCAKAARVLRDRFAAEIESGELEMPTDRTLQNWKKGTYRNRYQEIITGRAKELEELVASKGIEFALRAQDAKIEALRQVSARMGSVDAVEASVIMRNLAQAETAGVTTAGQIRNRDGFKGGDTRSLKQIAAALERLGVVEVDAEEITDAQEVLDAGDQASATQPA